jgi:hypothetical protein
VHRISTNHILAVATLLLVATAVCSQTQPSRETRIAAAATQFCRDNPKTDPADCGHIAELQIKHEDLVEKIKVEKQQAEDRKEAERIAHTPEALCKANPKWKQSECERVSKKAIWIGMTADMLMASQGHPAHIKTLTTSAGTAQLWVYEKQTGAAFRDDECVAGCKTEIFSVHIAPTLRVDVIEH